MNGRTAKRIRKALGYDKENANDVQRRVYQTVKSQYTRIPAKYKKALIDRIEKNGRK